MSRKIGFVLFVVLGLLLFGSCNNIEVGDIFESDHERADARMEEIVSALADEDKEALKLLFSANALDEASDFDSKFDELFDFIQGDIVSWERDGFASSQSISNGKKSLMLRFAIDVSTDEDVYHFYVIDFNIDTINPDNQGVYMLEFIDNYGQTILGSWQERMCAGISIVE